MANGDLEQFNWRNWRAGDFPELADHSERKLEVFRDYLVLYLRIVLANARGKDTQQLTLVDGFAGGGLYQNRKYGSPLVLLKAVEEAEALINIGREKKVRIVPYSYFVEEEPNAFASLEHALRQAGYGAAIGDTIHLRNRPFVECVPEIVSAINVRHSRGGNRTLFFLDQCGYKQVPAALIRSIDQQLNGRAEFIINFSIGWLGDFLSTSRFKNCDSMMQRLGLEQHVNTDALLRQRSALHGSWRHAVESHIGRGYHLATGIRYFSPFYIEPRDNHRGYWLLHLAQNQRARAAMTQIHWSKANRSKHYGPRGYGILGYKPDLDPTLYIEGMAFNEANRAACQQQLASEYAALIHKDFREGVAYEDLAIRTCNHTIADGTMLDEVLWQLFAANQIEIKSQSGLQKRTRTLTATDLVLPKTQLVFPGFGTSPAPPLRARQG